VRLAFVLDNFSADLTTKTDPRIGEWAAANNVELAYVPFHASWMNRIEAQFTGLRYFGARRHRPPRPRHPRAHDPPLHSVAKPQRPRPPSTPRRQQGKRCLIRH
jgi:hypothetical protein